MTGRPNPEQLGNSEQGSSVSLPTERGGVRWRDALIALGVLTSGVFAGSIDCLALRMISQGEPLINFWQFTEQPADDLSTLAIITGSFGGFVLSGLTIVANYRPSNSKLS